MSDLFTPQKLFDRIINVSLYTVGAVASALASRGQTVTLGNGQIAALSSYIQCPKVGRKPTISLRGGIHPSPILSDLELRVTNLYTGDIPLDNYRYIKIEAGYATELDTSIEGEIANAYQETPGPDGVTVFTMLLGYFSNWSNVVASRGWTKGTQVNLILTMCASLLGMTLVSKLDDSLVTQVDYSFVGLVSRFVSDLAKSLGVNIYPDGPRLKAYPKDASMEDHHVMKYFKTSPRHEAYGYNFTALWDPSIRPGSVLDISSAYIRQSYGGAQVGNAQTSFIVQDIPSFDFSTTDDVNTMNVIATAAQ